MKTTPTYIISGVSFDLGRFKPIFNDCSILRESIYRVNKSLQCSSFSDYISAVDFICNTFKEIDCPFRFFLDSVRVVTTDDTDIEYVLLNVFVNVS